MHIPGKLKWIAVGHDIVIGVNSADDIYYRVGINRDKPVGTKWVRISGKLAQVDVFGRYVLGSNSAQNIYSQYIPF